MGRCAAGFRSGPDWINTIINNPPTMVGCFFTPPRAITGIYFKWQACAFSHQLRLRENWFSQEGR